MGLDSLLTLQRDDLFRPLMDWVCITRGAGGGGGGGGGGEEKEEEEERVSSEATSRRWRIERKERERALGER